MKPLAFLLVVLFLVVGGGTAQTVNASTNASVKPAYQRNLPGKARLIQQVKVLENRLTLIEPQAAELLNTKHLADKIAGSNVSEGERTAARTVSARTSRQIDIAVNLSKKGRIVGTGRPAQPGDFPYQVALVFAGYANARQGQFCGGSLIDQQWVLTAAHCLRANTRPRDIEVFVGSVQLSQGGRLVPLQKIVRHNGFNNQTMINDVALLQLSAPITDQQIIPLVDLGLEQQILSESAIAVITGWGDTQQDSGLGSDILLYANVPIVDRNVCNSPESYDGRISDGMFCAGDGQTDSCQGDSGGPLVMFGPDRKRYQEGVVSWGEGCAQPKKYGVYTRVPQYITWIRAQMQ